MKQPLKRLKIVAVLMAAVVTLLGGGLFLANWLDVSERVADPAEAYELLADSSKLDSLYQRWVKGHEKNGGDHNVVIALGWSPAYSKDYTSTKGVARLNLV